MIETQQKLIQIGSSQGVTLSKKVIAALGAQRGDMLKIRVERVTQPPQHDDLLQDYNAFLEAYGQTLKNLADR